MINSDKRTEIAVIILTYNEQKNIAQALESVCGWARQVFVLDSLSSDRTPEIVSSYDAICYRHRFEGFVEQRNYALDHLPINTSWVLFLDADEWLTSELKQELTEVLHQNPDETGFLVKRRFIWMGKWIRRGYYPIWLLRVMRFGKGRWEARAVNEHLVVSGRVGYLNNDIVHEDHRSVSEWILKHSDYAELEARELLKSYAPGDNLPARLLGNQAERKRWMRQKVWNHLPLLLRPLLYFSYRLIVRRGILDGRRGYSYHFLQALWYPTLIDIKYLEMKTAALAEAQSFSDQSLENGRDADEASA